jgi:hypothetical protein
MSTSPGLLSGTGRLEVPALEPPTTRGAVRNLLGVGFARLQVVEKTPTRVCLLPTTALPRFCASAGTDKAAQPSAHPLSGFVLHIVTYRTISGTSWPWNEPRAIKKAGAPARR